MWQRLCQKGEKMMLVPRMARAFGNWREPKAAAGVRSLQRPGPRFVAPALAAHLVIKLRRAKKRDVMS
jgi:hypothetical protein